MVSCTIVDIHESQSGEKSILGKSKQTDISEFVSVNGDSTWTKRRVHRIYGGCLKRGLAHGCDGSRRFSSELGQLEPNESSEFQPCGTTIPEYVVPVYRPADVRY